MFLRGKKLCRKKTKLLCSVFCLFLSVLLSLCSWSSASAISPSSYNIRYSALAGTDWRYGVSQGTKFGFDYLYNYEWVIDTIPITGNTANIHFETNVVLQGSMFGLNSRFHNTDLLTVHYCGSTGHSVNLKTVSVSSAQTDWTNSDGYRMRTLTIYADVIASGFSNGSSDLYCNVGLSNNWAFAARTNSDYGLATAYFEQQPTRVSFTNDNTDAYQQQQIAELNNISRSLDNLANDNNEMEVYEREQADLEDKGDELEQDSGDLSLSANPLDHPFLNLFGSYQYACYTTSRLHQLFGSSAWLICSPYPTQYQFLISSVGTMVIIAILLRLYYKKLKGGVDG